LEPDVTEPYWFYRQRAAAEHKAAKLNQEMPMFKHSVREFAGHVVTVKTTAPIRNILAGYISPLR
jgi:hypothetical protein